MAQNGRVKGHELSSSYKKKKKKKETTPKSQLTIEPLNSDHQKKKIWNLQKKKMIPYI